MPWRNGIQGVFTVKKTRDYLMYEMLAFKA